MSMGQSDKILESEGRGIHFRLGETFVSVSKGVSGGERSILGNFCKISIALLGAGLNGLVSLSPLSIKNSD